MLHQAKSGQYGSGRHTTALPVSIDPYLILAWFGWGFPELKKWHNRQINPVKGGVGTGHHIWKDCVCDAVYRNELNLSTDLLTDSVYKSCLEKIIPEKVPYCQPFDPSIVVSDNYILTQENIDGLNNHYKLWNIKKTMFC